MSFFRTYLAQLLIEDKPGSRRLGDRKPQRNRRMESPISASSLESEVQAPEGCMQPALPEIAPLSPLPDL